MNTPPKTIGLLALLLAMTSLLLPGCDSDVAVKDAGTYEGKIVKVVPDEKEIYVLLDSGEKLELYFTDTTTVTKGSSSAATAPAATMPAAQTLDFSALKVDDKVRVTVSRTGNRNDPVSVEIIE